MKRYIVESEVFQGYILLSYDGHLVQWEINAKMSNTQYQAFFKIVPTHHSGLQAFKKIMIRNGTATVQEYKDGLSFEVFWEKYGYKEGNKKRTKGYWNKLNNANRNRAIFYLGRYERELKSKPHQQKLYADSYLNQERWNN